LFEERKLMLTPSSKQDRVETLPPLEGLLPEDLVAEAALSLQEVEIAAASGHLYTGRLYDALPDMPPVNLVLDRESFVDGRLTPGTRVVLLPCNGSSDARAAYGLSERNEETEYAQLEGVAVLPAKHLAKLQQITAEEALRFDRLHRQSGDLPAWQSLQQELLKRVGWYLTLYLNGTTHLNADECRQLEVVRSQYRQLSSAIENAAAAVLERSVKAIADDLNKTLKSIGQAECPYASVDHLRLAHDQIHAAVKKEWAKRNMEEYACTARIEPLLASSIGLAQRLRGVLDVISRLQSAAVGDPHPDQCLNHLEIPAIISRPASSKSRPGYDASLSAQIVAGNKDRFIVALKQIPDPQSGAYYDLTTRIGGECKLRVVSIDENGAVVCERSSHPSPQQLNDFFRNLTKALGANSAALLSRQIFYDLDDLAAYLSPKAAPAEERPAAGNLARRPINSPALDLSYKSVEHEANRAMLGYFGSCMREKSGFRSEDSIYSLEFPLIDGSPKPPPFVIHFVIYPDGVQSFYNSVLLRDLSRMPGGATRKIPAPLAPQSFGGPCIELLSTAEGQHIQSVVLIEALTRAARQSILPILSGTIGLLSQRELIIVPPGVRKLGEVDVPQEVGPCVRKHLYVWQRSVR
jgi:hypothetical protein